MDWFKFLKKLQVKSLWANFTFRWGIAGVASRLLTVVLPPPPYSHKEMLFLGSCTALSGPVKAQDPDSNLMALKLAEPVLRNILFDCFNFKKGILSGFDP